MFGIELAVKYHSYFEITVVTNLVSKSHVHIISRYNLHDIHILRVAIDVQVLLMYTTGHESAMFGL